jgi:shikimate kinase
MKVFLVGYMSSGKTTIGKVLAEKMNFQFIDLDQYIESKEDMSVPDIFKLKGEIYFRKIEALFLKELIESDIKAIISLGGGTPCYGNNMELLLNSEDAITIYLKASLNELVKRLNKDKQNRPLIAHLDSDEALLEFIGKHLFERNQFYNQANYTVETDNASVTTIVEDIVLKLF